MKSNRGLIKMNCFLLASTCLILSINLNAQTIKGVVLDKKSKKQIRFVSIGIINTLQGAYAYNDGQFEMEVAEYKVADSLRFSCVGYYPATFSVNDFMENYNTGFNTVYLTERITELGEVIIEGKQIKSKTIGNKISSNYGRHGFVSTMERGIIIKNKSRLFLKKVAFKVTMAGEEAPDSAIFRFNIYNLKDELPYENMLNQPIYFHLKNEQFEGTNEFDLSKYDITISEDFAATFELVEKIGGSQIYFIGRPHGNRTVLKRGIQGEWASTRADIYDPGDNLGVKMYQCLEIEVLYEK